MLHSAYQNVMTSRATSLPAAGEVREFTDPRAYFHDLDESGVARLVMRGSDISLILSEEGEIEDLAFRDHGFKDYKADRWIGQKFSDIVTPESIEKVTALLADAGRETITTARQLNHPGDRGPDLPVTYRLVKLSESGPIFAFGENQSKVANAQSRLVQAQMELEADYRKLRETEARYRTIFQMAKRAVIVVDGANRTIMDANRSAGQMFGKDAEKLVGDSAANLLDRASRKDGVEIMTEAHYKGSAKSFKSKVAFDGQDCLVSVEPFRENGQNNLLVKFDRTGTITDIADTRNEQDIELLKNLPEGVALLDTQGNVLEVNEQFLDLVQALNKDRIIGRQVSNWLGASSVDSQVLLSKLKKEGRVTNFATVARGEAGGSNDVSVSASSTVVGDETRFIIIISEGNRRERALPAQPFGAETDPNGISELVGRVPMKELIRDSVDVIEKMCIEAALNQTNNNRASAADLLGLSRQSLYIKLKRYGLEDFGDDS